MKSRKLKETMIIDKGWFLCLSNCTAASCTIPVTLGC